MKTKERDIETQKQEKQTLTEYLKLQPRERFLIAVQKQNKEIKLYDIKDMSNEDCQYIINQIEAHLISLGKTII